MKFHVLFGICFCNLIFGLGARAASAALEVVEDAKEPVEIEKNPKLPGIGGSVIPEDDRIQINFLKLLSAILIMKNPAPIEVTTATRMLMQETLNNQIENYGFQSYLLTSMLRVYNSNPDVQMVNMLNIMESQSPTNSPMAVSAGKIIQWLKVPEGMHFLDEVKLYVRNLFQWTFATMPKYTSDSELMGFNNMKPEPSRLSRSLLPSDSNIQKNKDIDENDKLVGDRYSDVGIGIIIEDSHRKRPGNNGGYPPGRPGHSPGRQPGRPNDGHGRPGPHDQDRYPNDRDRPGHGGQSHPRPPHDHYPDNRPGHNPRPPHDHYPDNRPGHNPRPPHDHYPDNRPSHPRPPHDHYPDNRPGHHPGQRPPLDRYPEDHHPGDGHGRPGSIRDKLCIERIPSRKFRTIEI